MALTSGRLAAETIVELNRHGRPMTARHLSLYRDKLERSPVLQRSAAPAQINGVSMALRPTPAIWREVGGRRVGELFKARSTATRR